MPGGLTYLGDFVVQESGGEVQSQSVGNKALKSTCADSATIEVNSTTGKLQLIDAGTSKSNGVGRANMSKEAGFWLKGSLTASDSAGGVFAEENTYGTDLVVTRVLIAVTTGTSGACELDIGIAADATTKGEDLMDTLDVSDAGVFDNITDGGSAGKSRQKLASGEFVTATADTGASAGLVGTYAIHCIDIIS